MKPINLREAVQDAHGLQGRDFENFMLNETLFRRAKIVRMLVAWFYTDFLFSEKHLMQEVGKSMSLKEVHDEVDFYQHKYVAGSIMKESLKIRVSGMKLIHIAERAFANSSR